MVVARGKIKDDSGVAAFSDTGLGARYIPRSLAIAP
jgi:hypothetical protein